MGKIAQICKRFHRNHTHLLKHLTDVFKRKKNTQKCTLLRVFLIIKNFIPEFPGWVASAYPFIQLAYPFRGKCASGRETLFWINV